MMRTRRLGTSTWTLIAVISVVLSFAFQPAIAAIRHQCADLLQTENLSNEAERHPTTPACCAMHCCPILQETAPGFAVIRLGLVPPVRVDVEDPLILDRNPDPPPRVGST